VAGTARFAAAALDGRARAVLVAWLSAWFAVVALLLGWSLAGGGTAALAAAAAVGTVLPLAVLVRLAGLPSAFLLAGEHLAVQRYLLPARTFTVRGPVDARPTAPDAGGPSGLGVGLGAGYGCRWSRGAAPGGGRVYRAVTDPSRAVRVGAVEGTLLVTPADPAAFVRAARTAAARAGEPGAGQPG
jgi:hypothetical protein